MLAVGVGAVVTALVLSGSAGARRIRHQAEYRCAGANVAPAKATLHFLRTSVLCLVNRVRDHYGLPVLSYSQELRRSASGHSSDMVRHRFFSHTGSRGSTLSVRVARSGYLGRTAYYMVGENIGDGVGQRLGSPLAIFRAWMHSPPHRANILERRFDDDGVGVSRGFPLGRHRDAATYTLDFGTRR